MHSESWIERLVEHHTLKFDRSTIPLIRQFIKDRRLVIYGGMAMNTLLSEENKIYTPDQNPDFDIMSPDSDQDSRDFAQILKDAGYHYVRIVTGLTGNSRRVFSGFTGNSICDFTQLTDWKAKRIQPVVIIDDLMYANPQYLKIDMYRHLTTKLFRDYSRIHKAQKRLKLMNQEFPFQRAQETQETQETPDLQELKKLQQEHPDLIFGGPLVANVILGRSPSGPVFLISQELHNPPLTISEEMTVKENAESIDSWSIPQGDYIGYAEEIFYVEHEIGRILTIDGLIFYFLLTNEGQYDQYIYDLFHLPRAESEPEIMKYPGKKTKTKLLPTLFL